MITFFIDTGKYASKLFSSIGELILIFLRCLNWVFRGKREREETVWQFYFVGVQSIPVVLTTGAFTGMVLCYAAYHQLDRLGVGSWTGPLVAKALVWQLGPVLVGLMLAGRVGCAMTAELGTMNVTEQIDALRTMGKDPVTYLITPRLLACTVMTPVLSAFSMLIGILSGLVLTVYGLGGQWYYLWTQINNWMEPYDYVQGLCKSVVFGIVICLICCRNGLNTTGGAEGVGKSTTTANVSSCISVLVLNLLLTIILLYLQPVWDYTTTGLDNVWAWLSGLWFG